MDRFHHLILLFVLALFAVACRVSEVSSVTSTTNLSPTLTDRPPSTSTLTITHTPVPTNTPSPTSTPTVTNTPNPTNTPRPTSTPRPTATPTPTPVPILLSGQGDTVIDLEKWKGPALTRISYTGGGNFAIWSYDEYGNKIDLLVNTIGTYEGTVPIDFLVDEFTTRFEVTSNGQWEIQVLPLQQIRRESIPGTMTGKGDEVLFLDGRNPDLLTADATTARGNFAIWTYGDSRDLVVNEIAPYQGTVVIGRDTLILVISAEGEWSIEVTTR